MNVIDFEKPEGVVVSLGGQTPINLANDLANLGVKIIGSQVEAIDVAEDRDLFEKAMEKLNIPLPKGFAVTGVDEGVKVAKEIGYPVLVRPSFVLGGRMMRIINDEDALKSFMKEVISFDSEHPVLIDKYIYGIEAEDCGCKLNIIRKLNGLRCNVTVIPYNSSVEDILRYKPDGLFISNGPGDPEDVVSVINVIKTLKGKLPMLGICLGHQMIGLAYGAKTYKMKFGHRGANHPVKNLMTGKVEITSQNHSYAVDQESLKGTGLELTHINLLDNETEGMMDKENKVIAVQYHPESAAGPEDSTYIFQGFLDNMKAFKEGK